MANKPISQYDELEAISDDDVFIVSQDGIAYGFTLEDLTRSIESE